MGFETGGLKRLGRLLLLAKVSTAATDVLALALVVLAELVAAGSGPRAVVVVVVADLGCCVGGAVRGSPASPEAATQRQLNADVRSAL